MHCRQEMILWCETIGSVACLKSGASSLFVCQCPAKRGFCAVKIAILIGSFVQIFELIPAISLTWKQKSYFQIIFFLAFKKCWGKFPNANITSVRWDGEIRVCTFVRFTTNYKQLKHENRHDFFFEKKENKYK